MLLRVCLCDVLGRDGFARLMRNGRVMTVASTIARAVDRMADMRTAVHVTFEAPREAPVYGTQQQEQDAELDDLKRGFSPATTPEIVGVWLEPLICEEVQKATHGSRSLTAALALAAPPECLPFYPLAPKPHSKHVYTRPYRARDGALGGCGTCA